VSSIKISLVICTYLLERLNDLYQALKSIDKQTYRNVEIIIVVDGNRKLYERIESCLPSLGINNISVVFSKENRGLAHSRNLGVKHSMEMLWLSWMMIHLQTSTG